MGIVELIVSILVLLAIIVVAWAVVRFFFRVTGCILYGILVGIVAIGIVVILLIFI